jgi:hypothetical protein
MITMWRVFNIIFSIFIFLNSCNDETNQNKNHIVKFDLKELPKISNIRLSELGFLDINYIPLETNERSIIQGSNGSYMGTKIIVGDGFYILKHFNTILKFLNNGSFITKIGKEGRGPNEFLVAHDVDVDKNNQNIYLLAGLQKKIFVYSKSGEFLKNIQVPFSTEFKVLENEILCYSENHMGNIENSYSLININGRIIKSFHNLYPLNSHNAYFIWYENLFYIFNNRLYKKEVYSDTIHVLEDMSFKPHLVIEVGKRLMTPSARSKFDGIFLGENYISPANLFEFGDYIYYEFIYKFSLRNDVLAYSFIGSKKNNFQVLFKTSVGIINDLDGGPNILPRTIQDDYTIIALLDAVQLKNHVASEEFKNSTPIYPEKKKELEKLANRLKETDNPVLVLVRLKK